MVNGKRVASNLDVWMAQLAAGLEAELRTNADLYNADQELSVLLMDVRDAAIKVGTITKIRLETLAPHFVRAEK